MAAYYNFAHGTRTLPLSVNHPWPYYIDLCFEPVATPVALSEGVAHGAAGCTVSAAEAVLPLWREHFARADGEWLLPFIQALADGVALPREVMFALYSQRHGHPPPGRGSARS